MLEVFSKIFGGILMVGTGYIVVGNITNNTDKKILPKDIFILFILFLFTIISYPSNYTIIYTISITLLNILIYKFVFNLNLTQAITSVTIFMILLFLSDFIIAACLRIFNSIIEIRNNNILFLLANFSVSMMCILLLKIKKAKAQLNSFYQSVQSKEKIINIIFLILLVIDFCILSYNLTRLEIYKVEYLINFIGTIIFGIIAYCYIKSKNEYNKLSAEYDNLFFYVQTFEEWIEKEQLNRHEYKNQLAVIRCLTKEKKVKDKIDEILEDNINIDDQCLTNLKQLPKGGMKGLMYYKAAIAQKKKINLSTDISIESKGLLSKLSEKDMKTLCKLIGIYFDNAIEASLESKKKILLIEVYELKDKVSIVFSNTFKKNKNIEDRNKKGVSSKGLGRGNGLYFASKLIAKNPWLKEEQKIIDNYYIERLMIEK